MKHCYSFPLSISILCLTQRLTAAAATRQHDNDGQQRPNNNMRGSRVRRLQDCFQVCTMVWDPVCGSDGTTYSNACMLNTAKCDNQNLRLVNQGDCSVGTTGCSQTRVCTREWVPVCGNDGTTYDNACLLTTARRCGNQNLRQVFKGDCNARTTDCSQTAICTRQYIPVCGSDGTTYSNACTLNRARCNNQDLRLMTQGVCGAADERSCTDDTKTFRDKQKKLTCRFVNTTTTRKEYWCQRPKPKRICPDTCNTCGSADRSAGGCTDDGGATFPIQSSHTEITCADLAGYAQRKTEYWCDRSDVAPVSCRATCNTC